MWAEMNVTQLCWRRKGFVKNLMKRRDGQVKREEAIVLEPWVGSIFESSGDIG